MTATRAGMSRRALLAAAGSVLAGLAGVTAGCGSREFVQATGAVPARYARRTHIVFWHSFASIVGDAMQKLVDEFNDSQDEIYVDAQFQGSYDQTAQKLAAGIIAKQVPDISIFSEITWRKFHLADALEPLNDYFDADLAPTAYIDQFIQEGTVKGTIWWMPFARSTPLFYYNKEIFAKAGLPDRGPRTWTELREWGPAIQGVRTASGPAKVHALTSGDADWFFQAKVWQWGGNYSKGLEVTIDTERPIAAGQWMVDFIRKDKMAYLSASSNIDFANGVAATTEMSTGGLRNATEQAKFPVGAAFLPAFEHFGCPTGGSGFGILASSTPARKRAAFEFVKFVATPEKSAQWSIATGYLPIIKAAQRVPALLAATKDNPNFAVAVRQLEKTRVQDLARLVVPNANVTMYTALQRLYSSRDGVPDVFATLARKLRSSADLMREKYERHYT
jgi:sn-glycerol 3-phosphate transport system substrate-binding protein